MIPTFALGALAAATVLAAGIVWMIRNDSRTDADAEVVEHHGADADYAAELHEMAEADQPRHLRPDWADLLDPDPDPDRPEPVLVRQYVARHVQDETVNLARVTGAARIRALYTDTEQMPAVQA